MAVPKKRTSVSRKGLRRAGQHHKLYRKFPQGSHIVFYKDGSTSKIEIIRVLHKSMDVDTQILGA